MVYRVIVIVILSSLVEGCWENFNLERQILYKDAKIIWYWRSLGDDRRDFVEVIKGSQRAVVLNCTTTITDVNIINDSIVIRTGYISPSNIYSSNGNGLGVPVWIDPTATEEEIDKFQNRQFYENERKFKANQSKEDTHRAK